MIRLQPKINPFPPEVKTYDEYSAGLNSFMSLTTSRIDELRGSMLLFLEPSFISVLTNCYYGGKLANFPSAKAEFTATEDRIIEIVPNGISQCLETAWKDLMPITIKQQSREINPQFATLVESSDSVIICSFVVQLPNVDSASFSAIKLLLNIYNLFFKLTATWPFVSPISALNKILSFTKKSTPSTGGKFITSPSLN